MVINIHMWQTALKFCTDAKSTRELVKIGVVGGLALQAVSTLIDSAWVQPDEAVHTDALYKDLELMSLFRRVWGYRHLSTDCCQDAIQNADRLVYRYTQLCGGQIKPDLHDRLDAFRFFKASTANLLLMCDASKKTEPARSVVTLHRLYTKIYYKLKEYFQAVMGLTESL